METRLVAASTQNQALAAILFLYDAVLGRPLGLVDPFPRAKRPHRLPVVLTRQEVEAVLSRMTGTHRLVASLLYGSGLRLLEGLRLRVKDVDFGSHSGGHLVVHEGKGDRDRIALLPNSVGDALRDQTRHVRRVHRQDLDDDSGAVHLPTALAHNYPLVGRRGSTSSQPTRRPSTRGRASCGGTIFPSRRCRRPSARHRSGRV